MWAMIPKLPTLARSVSTSRATKLPLSLRAACSAPLDWLTWAGPGWGPAAASPAVVGESLVGLGHLVRVLAALDTRAEPVARVEQLVHQALDHGLLPASAGEADQPT